MAEWLKAAVCEPTVILNLSVQLFVPELIGIHSDCKVAVFQLTHF